MEAAPASVTCPRCGAVTGHDARFCGRCGVPVTVAVRAVDGELELLRQATLGEYEIAGELGRGGMATVYLGHDLSLDRKVAIKLLQPDPKGGLPHAERFKQEARIAASLSHPNIIPIYAVKQVGAALFIVMKYLAGRPLDALIREQGPLPPATVRHVLLQVAAALAYAHRHGVVHRDVKPANVMLDPDGTVTVTDFGIAKAAQMDGLTRSGATIGTPTYMSPEQCAGREVTGASDQYSLGILAYELLAGRVPFDQDTLVSIIWAHYHEPPRELLTVRPDCPRDLAAVVMRMLAKAPSARWPSLTALGDALRRTGGTEEAGHRRSPAEAPPPGAPRPAARPAELVITPTGGSLEAGEIVRYSAALATEPGRSEPLTARWSSSDEAVLQVTEDGIATALRPGVAVLTAAAAGHESSVSLQVTRVGVAGLAIAPARHAMTVADLVQLQVAAQDGFGTRLGGRVVVWGSNRPEVATVSRTGVVEALAPGVAEISAATGGLSAVAVVRVGPPVVSSVRVSPASATLSPGESQHFHAVPVNAQGRTIPGVEIAWVTSDESVAEVDDRGMVTGHRGGVARLAAVAGGRRTTIAVTVLPRRRTPP